MNKMADTGSETRGRPAGASREAGFVLVHVTLALILTMLIIPPLLGFIGGAGRTAQIREDRMLKVYAADAGIEDAYFRITRGNVTEFPWTGTLPALNGHEVSVQIEREATGGYKITSVATGYDGSHVTIESHAAAEDYSDFLLNNALVSRGDIKLQPGVLVDGNVTLNGELINKGTITGDEQRGVSSWPAEEDLKKWYGDQTAGHSYYGSSIDLQQDEAIGPLHREGDFEIRSSNSTAALHLTGTVYVTGDLVIGQTKQDFALHLNGQTVFCEGSIDIADKATIVGSGSIIALGDVFFLPKVQSSSTDFLLVMSVSGTLQAQPQGDFYGTMAGAVTIVYQPKGSIAWRPTPSDLNLPEGELVAGIQSYIIRD